MSNKKLFLAQYGDKDHLENLLNDNDPDVVDFATTNPNYRKYYPNGHTKWTSKKP